MAELTIKERLARVCQLEYVSVNDFSLLTGMSERTVWRRLRAGVFPITLHSGRVTTIHRVSALRALRCFDPPISRNPVNTAQSAMQ